MVFCRDQHDADGEEGKHHGADMRGGAGEHVVGEGEDQHEDRGRHRPAQVCMRDHVLHAVREPADHTKFVQLVGHHDERTEPDERIPGAFFRQHIIPVDRAGDQESEETEHCDHGRVEREGRSEDHRRNVGPKDQQHDESADHHHFLARQRPHRRQFLPGIRNGIRRALKLRRRDHVEHERHDHERDQTRHEHGQRPGNPGQLHRAAGRLRDIFEHQRVRRGRGDEHRRRNRVGVIIHQRQIGADLTLRPLCRIRIEGIGDRLHDRVDDAAATCGVARCKRR
ncbi:hypothetical protein D3C80_521010 [compost metagenome]